VRWWPGAVRADERGGGISQPSNMALALIVLATGIVEALVVSPFVVSALAQLLFDPIELVNLAGRIARLEQQKGLRPGARARLCRHG
jgi:hypothetical protein